MPLLHQRLFDAIHFIVLSGVNTSVLHAKFMGAVLCLAAAAAAGRSFDTPRSTA
jgi:hypothetical protein